MLGIPRRQACNADMIPRSCELAVLVISFLAAGGVGAVFKFLHLHVNLRLTVKIFPWEN